MLTNLIRMRKQLILFLLLLTALVADASDKMNFQVLDVRTGISDNYIQDILHDRYGFVWFATRNGLNRYDGYHFKYYTIHQLGAYDNHVEHVWEDASGTIWIKTPVNYCYYNREKDKLENTVSSLLQPMGIPSHISQLYVDEDRNLWCIAGHTLYYYTFATGCLHTLPLPEGLAVGSLTCRKANAYLLLTDGNIATIDWSRNELQTVIGTDGYSPSLAPHIYIDNDLNLWVYATHGPDIRCYSLQEKQWIAFPGQQALTADRCNVTTVTDDGKGNIWIGTDNSGIIVSHLARQTFTHINKESGRMYALPSNHITCFLKDENDMMWIGTGKQGVTYARLSRLIFENHQCPHQEDISCMYEADDGSLWLGFDGEGIARYHPGRKQYTCYRSKEKAIPSDLIVSSFLDSKGRLWWGSFGGGAFYYQNGQFVSPSYRHCPQGIRPPQYIRRIAEDAAGNIWLATYSEGLFRLDPQGNLQVFTMKNSVLLTNYIADLCCTDGETLYIATSSGVYCMDAATLELTEMRYRRTGGPLIDDNFANCIYQDSRGLLWIGGRKGVHVYHPQTDSLQQLTTDDGISHPYIRAIVENQEGNIWLTTDHGITYIRTQGAAVKDGKYHCHPYFEQDGLGGFTFNNFSIFCNRQGEVFMGGAGGYVKINAVIPPDRHRPEQVIFTELYVDGNRVNAARPVADGRILLPKNIQSLDEITLDHSDNNFSIEVSAMDYGNLHQLQYVYRLGKKDKWLKMDGNRLHFNKLAAGTYQLEVKVDDHYDSTRHPVTTLTLHITPPFWRSTLAYIVYAMTLCAVIVLIAVRTKQKHLRQLAQQKRELEIAQRQEMDEAKLRFYTNVSHDLRTPLSLIIIPLEKVLKSDLTVGIREEMERMHRNALVLLDVVNQLLDLRRIENGKAQLHLSHGDLVGFVKSICDSFQPYADRRHIRLLWETAPDSQIETDFDRNKMQRIVMNLLSNAFKYNTENGSVTVRIYQQSDAGERPQACLQVADTGIGIKDENKERIFDRFFQEEHAGATYIGSGIGMHIVKEYVHLQGGTIHVTDNSPQGTVFTLFFPITNGQPDEPVVPELPAVCPPQEGTDPQATLLVVEDNDDFRSFLCHCLSEEFTVLPAANGQEALRTLAANESVSMVISDILMPVMDGLELCNRIKSDLRFSHVPVILLTARTAEEHMVEGLREGADDYITKPFNLDILFLRIRKLLAWTQRNHRQFGNTNIVPSEITVSHLDQQLLTRALEAVEKNMDNSEFGVEDLSAAVGMSRGHLYKKLTSITGKSPLEFIRILRIRKGKELLETGTDNISQIAYQVGLSPKLFAKYFKEEFGCLPSEYRQSS